MDKIYSISADKAQMAARIETHNVSSENLTAVVLDHATTWVRKASFYTLPDKLFGGAMYGDDKDRLIEAWNREMYARANKAAQNYYPYLLEEPTKTTPDNTPAKPITDGAPLQACYLTWAELNTILIPWFVKNFPDVDGVEPEARPIDIMKGTGAWEIHLRGAGGNEQLRLQAAELGTAVTIGHDIIFGCTAVNDIVEHGLLLDTPPIALRSIQISVADDGGVYFIGEGL